MNGSVGYFVGSDEFLNPAFVVVISFTFRGFFSKCTRSREGGLYHLFLVHVEVFLKGVTNAKTPHAPRPCSLASLKSPRVTEKAMAIYSAKAVTLLLIL